MIIVEYQSYENFISHLEKISNRVPVFEKHRIDNIIIYYNNVFELELPMEPDVIAFRDLAYNDLRYLKIFYDKCPVNDVKFLIKIIEYNISYVLNSRKLA